VSEIRILAPGDEAIVEDFLAGHAPSSMFLRSNLRARGLAWRGEPLEAIWVAALDRGAVVAVAAHAWNDNVLLQAPRALDEVVRTAVRASGRPVRGLVGPWAQVVAARHALGLEGVRADVDERQGLYDLALARLAVPEVLARGEVTCAHATALDRELMIDWRVAYHGEALGRAETMAVRDEAAREIDLLLALGDLWVLRAAGLAVACTAFNARLPDCVQVGGVWTPPELRGRGHARAAVAASLLEARAAGVERSVLFAKEDNLPALRAYAALGYRAIGEYGLVLLGVPARAT
jgi:predicted GNAT family acetyltransferase